MTTLDKVAEFIHTHTNLRPDKGVLLGLSGGPDSQVLLHILISLNYSKIIAAHVNYHQRGENSELDEKCAENWAKRFSIEFRKKEVYLDKDNGNFQNGARIARYSWFEKIKNQEKLDYILTAHHKNDEIETTAMRFFSGTRGRGLTGMPPDSNERIKPLLCLSKNEILNYAKRHSIPFRIDESNSKGIYLRNFFRLEILPKIEEKIPNLYSRLETTRKNLQKEQKLLVHFTFKLIKESGYWKGPFLILPLNKLMENGLLNAFLVYLFKINENQSRQLIESPSSSILECFPYRLCVFNNQLWIGTSKDEKSRNTKVWNKSFPFTVNLNVGKLSVEKTEEFEKINDPNIEYLPAEFINADLRIEKWHSGDRIEYQKGKHKKVSDLLNENQLSPFERESVYCLWHEEELIWVIGIRLSCKGYVKSSNEQYLRLKYHPEKLSSPTEQDVLSILGDTFI
ncbi:MAG: tRNA lysidine(34) synthetase TilS [Bacteroidetes bacterium]|jgi:tRNA(Ile)-lysidine synthase|nr:tRNA lysidine(34) synthetase TilS [Bacteroidota bacterium]